MSSPQRLASLAAATLLAVVCAAPTHAAIHVSYAPASPLNYSHHARPASAVRLIVVHVTEGTFASTVAWFKNPRAHASAHFVVGRDGDVTQMVPTRDVAWHSGNGWVNQHSIGVEDEGFTNILGTFTDTEYRASAQLVAGLMRHYVLPIDRRHLIGHNQVPDPFHPGLFGGVSHHTDPGPFWDWHRYIDYVRAYARGLTPPPPPFDVTTDAPGFGQTVSAGVPWTATVEGETAESVSFSVDGQLRQTEQAPPFAYAPGLWDTTRETNGRHVLRVHAIATDGTEADSSLVVYVKNPPIKIRALTLTAGDTVSGAVQVTARVTGTPLRVEFLIDDVLRDTETALPYTFGGPTGMWDTTQETPGEHRITVRAIGPRERVAATRTIDVNVVNG